MFNVVPAVRRPDHSLTDAEVSVIKTVVQAAPGSWSAADFACECCGNTVVSIGPTCDAVVGPWFELSRDADQRIQLTTSWLDGEDYTSEFWSLNAALRCVLSMIAELANRSPRFRLTNEQLDNPETLAAETPWRASCFSLKGDAPMSANETAAKPAVVLATNCTFAGAEAARAALIEAGWQGPSEQLEAPPPPRTAAAIFSAGNLLTAHTDGACSGNPGPGGWAVVFSQGGIVVSKHSGRVDHATNNEMELMAIREAVSRAPLDADLEILTDSRNAVGWLAECWKRNKPELAALCGDIERLTAKHSGKITYRLVRGHQGDALNERADQLATGAIQRGAQNQQAELEAS